MNNVNLIPFSINFIELISTGSILACVTTTIQFPTLKLFNKMPLRKLDLSSLKTIWRPKTFLPDFQFKN